MFIYCNSTISDITVTVNRNCIVNSKPDPKHAETCLELYIPSLFGLFDSLYLRKALTSI